MASWQEKFKQIQAQAQAPSEVETEERVQRGEFLKRSRLGEDELQKQQLAGVREAGQGLLASAMQSPESFQQAIGMEQNPALQQALARRNRRALASDFTDLENRARFEAPTRRFQRMQQAVDPALGYLQIQQQRDAQTQAMDAQRRAARSQMISSIAGGLGGIAGIGLGAAIGGGGSSQ